MHDKATNVHIGARVPAELAAAFEQLARCEDRTVSAELRRLVRLRVESAKRVEQEPSEQPGRAAA